MASLALTPEQDHVAIGTERSILAAITRPPVNLAIWRRTLDRRLTAAARLVIEGAPELRFTAPAKDVPAGIRRGFDQAGIAESPDRKLFIADVAALAACYAGIMGAALLEVRLERITTNACHKFHADYVSARLITTYCGRGTEWIDNEDAARHVAGAVPSALTIHCLGEGEVALFKGRDWAAESPIIHRSPPIAGTGERRLVLVINPASS